VLLIGRRILQVAGFVARVLKPGLRGMAQNLRGAFQVVGGVIRTVSALIHGDFGGAIKGMRSVVAGAKNMVVGAFRSIGSVARSIFGRLGKLIASVIKAPINGVIAAWNAIHINLPRVKVLGRTVFGGGEIGLPHIQPLARGGVVRSPLQLVGEQGPELLAAPPGSRVFNTNQTARALGGGSALVAEVRAQTAAIDRLARAILEHPTILELHGREIARATSRTRWAKGVTA
jgi:hypothetical protein